MSLNQTTTGSESSLAARMLERGTIATNTLLLRRLKQIVVPRKAWAKFRKTAAFHRAVIATHAGRCWLLRKVDGQWACFVQSTI